MFQSLISFLVETNHATTDPVDRRSEKEESFPYFIYFNVLWLIMVRNEKNKNEPAIGIEPMTIALQVRRSHL